MLDSSADDRNPVLPITPVIDEAPGRLRYFPIGHQRGLLHSSKIGFGESASGHEPPRRSLAAVTGLHPIPAAPPVAAVKGQSQTLTNTVSVRISLASKPGYACAITRLSGAPMRNKRAFWMTLLVYAFAGPPVGLLSLVVISFVDAAWGPIIDRLEALIPHAQSLSCDPYSGPLDVRCFQLPPDPRQFSNPWRLREASLYVYSAYVIGLIPALLAGSFICAGRLRDGGAGFSYAVLVGTLVGLGTGVMAIKSS